MKNKLKNNAEASLTVIIKFFVSCSGLVSADAAIWTEFVDSTATSKPLLLPDFSYVGYAHGEKPIPDIAGPVFNVTDYGAVPDDDISDAVAVQKAVDACEAAGGGVVLFPKGVFIINDDYETATSARVRIRKSGVVLRGAGSGSGGTVLYSPKEMQPENPKNMWSGRSPVVVQPEGSIWGSRKSKITASAPMNGLSLRLETSHPFKPGDRVCLKMNRKGDKAAPFVAPHAWESEWTSGISIRELHEIASVDGAAVRLAEPLMMPVDDAGDWSLQEIRLISNVGVEDIFFRGAWREGFKHHRSWRDDSAWRGIYITGTENGWLRRCVFEDMNWPVHITGSRQVTVEDVKLTGYPAHFGIQVTGTYGVIGIGVIDSAGHHHGPSLQSGSCATVYHRCGWTGTTSFDSHANNPYATLHDCNEGGFDLSGVGGAKDNFPHHLHAMVVWNHTVNATPKKPVDFWTVGRDSYPRAFTQVIMAGLTGEPVKLVDDTVFRNESQGTPVTPRSLWLAQLEKRLGKVPEHFQPYVK